MRELLEALYPDPRKLTATRSNTSAGSTRGCSARATRCRTSPASPRKSRRRSTRPVRFATLYAASRLHSEQARQPRDGPVRPGLDVAGELREGDDGRVTVRRGSNPDDPRARRRRQVAVVCHGVVGEGSARRLPSSGTRSPTVTSGWRRSSTTWNARATRAAKRSTGSCSTRNRADLVEVTRRANKALVEFDNLLPIEKNYIRHFIFVYPWVSRSAVWSIRAALGASGPDGILAHLGEQDLSPTRSSSTHPHGSNAPATSRSAGTHDGTPRVVNPTSVNTFSTLGDFVSFAKASTVGDKYASAEDFLGPFPKFLVHGVTGRDEFGNQYPGSQWGTRRKLCCSGCRRSPPTSVPERRRAGPASCRTSLTVRRSRRR
jgi:hypothetical protein